MQAITLTPRDVVIDAGSLPRLQSHFDKHHCLLLEDLLETSLLQLLRPRLECGGWSEFLHGSIGSEVVLYDEQALGILHFAVNAPAVIDAVRTIARAPQITWFDGRIFRMDPKQGHHDSWHDDFARERVVGMSVNLSFGGFDGGEFEIREKGNRDPLSRISNLSVGNASLFRISPVLEHRVAPLRGERARTAFAGWFRSGEPDLLARLRPAP
jgi:hypothetical protein